MAFTLSAGTAKGSLLSIFEALLALVTGSDGSGGTVSTLVKAAPYTPLGDAQMISSELATSSALESLPPTATVAVIQNNGTQAVRWRDAGVPTMTLGQRLLAGETLTLDTGTAGLASARFIREADGAILDIAYYN